MSDSAGIALERLKALRDLFESAYRHTARWQHFFSRLNPIIADLEAAEYAACDELAMALEAIINDAVPMGAGQSYSVRSSRIRLATDVLARYRGDAAE